MELHRLSDGIQARPRPQTILIAALAAFAATLAVHPSIEGTLLAAGFSLLAACSAADVTGFRLPDIFTYFGALLMVVGSAVTGDVGSAVAGMAVGGGLLLALSTLSRGSVGRGDARLAAFGGAMVGGRYVVHALFVGSVAAAVTCVFLILTRRLDRDEPIPFAPFLALGFAILTLVAGSTLGV